MQELPKTFCPAKWDELMVNFESNLVYSCCKSVPTNIGNGDILENIKKERQNLLNGIQDPSCNYCWVPEQTEGTKSRRHMYLEKMESTDITAYQNNTAQLKYLEFNIGNQCNFQCMYCKPNFSSKWEDDIRKKAYKLYTDRHSYELPKKNKNVFERNLQFLREQKNLVKVGIIGGEPLYNKNFFKLVENINSKWLGLTTNLSCSKKTIDRLIKETQKFEHVALGVSLDATKAVDEFARYGISFDVWKENFDYLLANKPDSMVIQVNSVMTSITIRDIENFVVFMAQYVGKVKWYLGFCVNPKIQGFATLPDEYRPAIIKCLETLLDKPVTGVQALISTINATPFNNTMYNELVLFTKEFAERKNIEIPICLD